MQGANVCLELNDQLAQTLATFVVSILAGAWTVRRSKCCGAALRQIIDVLQKVMCTHDAEKLAISVREIYEGGHRDGNVSRLAARPSIEEEAARTRGHTYTTYRRAFGCT